MLTNVTPRLHFCNKCPFNVNRVCQSYKLIHPDRECNIDYGVKLPHAACPELLWKKAGTVVYPFHDDGPGAQPSLQYSVESVRAHFAHTDIMVVGDRNPYPTLPSPREKQPSNLTKWYDYNIKFQRIIDCPEITDDFLYMYDDTFFLSPTTIKEFYLPDWPDGGSMTWDAVRDMTLAQLPESVKNFSTHYPYYMNKAKLQDILDTYRQPYLIELIYMNLYCDNPVPVDRTFLFTRQLTVDLAPYVEVLNVKQFTYNIRDAVQCTL
jgi:hypothetical protein